jgi:hypothetical protein
MRLGAMVLAVVSMVLLAVATQHAAAQTPAHTKNKNKGTGCASGCTLSANLVCGANGVTYMGECLARCSGTSIAYRSACQPPNTDLQRQALAAGPNAKPSDLPPVDVAENPFAHDFALDLKRYPRASAADIKRYLSRGLVLAGYLTPPERLAAAGATGLANGDGSADYSESERLTAESDGLVDMRSFATFKNWAYVSNRPVLEPPAEWLGVLEPVATFSEDKPPPIAPHEEAPRRRRGLLNNATLSSSHGRRFLQARGEKFLRSQWGEVDAVSDFLGGCSSSFFPVACAPCAVACAPCAVACAPRTVRGRTLNPTTPPQKNKIKQKAKRASAPPPLRAVGQMIFLTSIGTVYCSGVLVSPKHVLSSTACLAGRTSGGTVYRTQTVDLVINKVRDTGDRRGPFGRAVRAQTCMVARGYTNRSPEEIASDSRMRWASSAMLLCEFAEPIVNTEPSEREAVKEIYGGDGSTIYFMTAPLNPTDDTRRGAAAVNQYVEFFLWFDRGGPLKEVIAESRARGAALGRAWAKEREKERERTGDGAARNPPPPLLADVRRTKKNRRKNTNTARHRRGTAHPQDGRREREPLFGVVSFFS